eukprot:s2823_g4.t2
MATMGCDAVQTYHDTCPVLRGPVGGTTMISSVLLVNLKGEILIWRAYKDNVTRADWTLFCGQVVAAKESTDKPVVSINGSHFLYITQGDIVLVACTKDNVNVMLVLKLLHKMVDLFKAYFGGAFDENQVRKNFVLIYELLRSRSCIPFGIDSGMFS